ncbi:MAG: hypothetical protein GMKNLPBB_00510 [Myxococcota bacterium]|nr:hypothetical protein [Myxococcota bacterium]
MTDASISGNPSSANPAEETARITELRIKGMRTLEDITLKLDGLTVLIGENGSGKSTIIEALSLLQVMRVAGSDFRELIVHRHGGIANILRNDGGQAISLGVDIEVRRGDVQENLKYDTSFESEPYGQNRIRVSQGSIKYTSNVKADPNHFHNGTIITFDNRQFTLSNSENSQKIVIPANAVNIFDRNFYTYLEQLFNNDPIEPPVQRLLGSGLTLVNRLSEIFRSSIKFQLPFDVTPRWRHFDYWAGKDFESAASLPGVGQGEPANSPLRDRQQIAPVHEMDPHGRNFASCIHHLRNTIGGRRWERFLNKIKSALAPFPLEDIVVPSIEPGMIEVHFMLEDGNLLRVSQFSSGQLSYLAFLTRLEMTGFASVIAFDELETHMHPYLMHCAVQELESFAKNTPVIVATHSNTLLNSLSDPVNQVVICELGDRRNTLLRRLDPKLMEKWLIHYGGVGSIREHGVLSDALKQEEQ